MINQKLAKTMCGGLFAILTPFATAQADSVQVTWGGWNGLFGTQNNGYETGSIAPNPNSQTALTAVGIGGDKDTYTYTGTNSALNPTGSGVAVTGSFTAWCVDIFHWLANGTSNYTTGTNNLFNTTATTDLAHELDVVNGVVNVPGQTRSSPVLTPGGAVRVGDLEALADNYYGSLKTTVDSAAFQLAVWAITYGALENGLFHIDTTNAGFKVDSATASSAWGQEANTWLANLGVASGKYTMTYLTDAVTGFQTQNLVVFTPTTAGHQNVPEPAILSLMSLGLAGLALTRRKIA